MNNQQQQKPFLLRRIFSLEGALAAFGLFSLGSGLSRAETLPIFWGATILIGLGALLAIRRRDWKTYWEEMEKQNALRLHPPQKEPPNA